eukprot:scaffold39584_cov31-Phaeocystis_antarctica.AAC.1
MQPLPAAVKIACQIPPSYGLRVAKRCSAPSSVAYPILEADLCCTQDREGSAPLPQVNEHGGPPSHHSQQEAVRVESRQEDPQGQGVSDAAGARAALGPEQVLSSCSKLRFTNVAAIRSELGLMVLGHRLRPSAHVAPRVAPPLYMPRHVRSNSAFFFALVVY